MVKERSVGLCVWGRGYGVSLQTVNGDLICTLEGGYEVGKEGKRGNSKPSIVLISFYATRTENSFLSRKLCMQWGGGGGYMRATGLCFFRDD